MSFWMSKKKIVVIEDEKDIAGNIQARLEMEGFQVILAHDGKSGFERVKFDRPDLVILDVMLPIADGYEVCSLIRADDKTKTIPVLMLTALPHIEDAEKAFAVGATDFLNKPYTNERLIQKVKKCLQL